MQSPEITNLLIFSLVILLLIELIPDQFRGIPALVVLFVIPFLWTKRLFATYSLDENYLTAMLVLEIVMIGFLLGYSGLLTPLAISISLVLSTLIKWGLIHFKNS